MIGEEQVGGGAACGTPGRDALCMGCEHRRWLHSGDKDECRHAAPGASACACVRFMRHVDDFIDDPTSDPYAAKWLGLFRRPALARIGAPNHDKLFATYDGKRWRVIGCSRLGDVWLTSDFSRENGYEKRVEVDKCSAFSATP